MSANSTLGIPPLAWDYIREVITFGRELGGCGVIGVLSTG